MENEVTIVKAKTIESIYFIFRGNGEEVTITVNSNNTIKANHKLTQIEVQFLRSEFPQFFNNKLETTND